MAAVAVFDWPIRVYYEDTDAGGVVYHSQYLNFLERARTEWLRALGYEQTTLRDELGIVIVVHSLEIRFKKPAKFNDRLTVSMSILDLGRSSITFAQKILRNDETLIEAQVRVACVNAHSFKPTGIPAEILQAISSISLNNSMESA